jgi:uncharacterized protein YcnI
VSVTPNTTAAGANAILTFSVGHGCEGSPTTEITIAMPEQILQVTPTRNPLWTVDKQVEQLDEPVTDAHGNEVTERVSQVVYTTDEPLPEGIRDTFELSLQLPDAAGETIAFPVVQTCQQGETGWTETAAEGQDPEELENPAPTVTLTEATEESPGTTEGAVAETDTESDGLAVAGVVTGVVGILVGGLALARTRRA